MRSILDGRNNSGYYFGQKLELLKLESLMRHVPIAELKDHLSEYLASVESGEVLVVTRHGKIISRISPPDNSDERRSRAEAAAQRIREHIARMRAEGRTSTNAERIAWKNEGRR